MKERTLMSEKEFKTHIKNSINLRDFRCVSKFKSVQRAYRRGHLTIYGIEIPRKPFNNRKHTLGRSMNILKKNIYGELTRRNIEAIQEA